MSRLGKNPGLHGFTGKMITHFYRVYLHNPRLCGLFDCRSQRLGGGMGLTPTPGQAPRLAANVFVGGMIKIL